MTSASARGQRLAHKLVGLKPLEQAEREKTLAKRDWGATALILVALGIWALGMDAVHNVNVLYEQACVVTVVGDDCDRASAGMAWLQTLVWLSPIALVIVVLMWRSANGANQLD